MANCYTITYATTTNGSYSTWAQPWAQPWAQSWDIDLERKYILNQAFDWDFCKPYVIFNDRKHKPKIDVTALLQLLIGEYQCL